MDKSSLIKLQQLHPKIKDAAVAAYQEACEKTPANVHPYVVQTLRTFAESDHDFQLGRTIKNPDGVDKNHPLGQIISDAKAGESYHNYGLALDLMLLIDGKESIEPNDIVVNIFKNHGFTWGGDFAGSFKDKPHFENKLGYTWHYLLPMYQAKKFIVGTTYLNI